MTKNMKNYPGRKELKSTLLQEFKTALVQEKVSKSGHKTLNRAGHISNWCGVIMPNFLNSEFSYFVNSNTCLKRPLKKKTKIVVQDGLLLNAGQKYCRVLYFQPSLVQHRKTHPCLTERLLMGRKESNQTNKQPSLSYHLS